MLNINKLKIFYRKDVIRFIKSQLKEKRWVRTEIGDNKYNIKIITTGSFQRTIFEYRPLENYLSVISQINVLCFKEYGFFLSDVLDNGGYLKTIITDYFSS